MLNLYERSNKKMSSLNAVEQCIVKFCEYFKGFISAFNPFWVKDSNRVEEDISPLMKLILLTLFLNILFRVFSWVILLSILGRVAVSFLSSWDQYQTPNGEGE